MKKVFASDFDGTLYFYKAEDPDKLPMESVEKIREYQEAGHLFGLCTGRQVGGLTPFITGFVEPDFFITSSGANIVDRHYDEIRKRGVDPDVAWAITNEMRAKGFRLTLDVDGDICVFEEMDYPGKYYVVSGPEDLPEGLIHQVSVHTESLEDAAANAAYINERFGDSIQAFQNVIEIDIAPKGCSKGKGVEALRDYYREAYGDVRLYGIGDSLNDLPLIEAADVSYTFPYAPEEVQKKVTKVVKNIVEALEDSMADDVYCRKLQGEVPNMSQALRDARRYEEGIETYIKPEDRPGFHLSARVGWMNDPNGFSFYMGQYHMFYQYHPYDSHWGPMHWGHAVSSDLLHWDYLPAALAPDRIYDRDGCFSGNAITLPDGRQMLMYTGIINEIGEGGKTLQVQTQNLAFGDGLDYEKYEGNPVLTEADLPEGGSKYGFRDPKPWRLADGSYRALIANDRGEGFGGQMLLYRSEDAVNWEFVKVFAENHSRLGRMWECPDFFELDGKYVLLGSSQDMLPKGLEYQNGNGTFYFTGTYDEETETFFEEADHTVDYGIDFYAPQTVLAPDGRRIMIGWMQNWDTCNLHTESTPWFGQMSIPRELSLKDGILYQTPIRELEELRCDEVVCDEVILDSEEKELDGISGRMLDLTVEIEPVGPEASFRRFAIRFAKDDDFYTEVRFRRKESTLKIDRMYSGSRRAIIHQRKALVSHDNGALKLRLILDRFSAEVFVNDGEKVMSTTLETDLSAERIAFLADGAVKLNVTKYTLAT